MALDANNVNVYGGAYDASTNPGGNTITHYYDRAGIKAANRVNVYQQFADRKSMPTKYGKTFKISRFEHMYDNELASAAFAANGYLSGRDYGAIEEFFDGSAADGRTALLGEGATGINKRELKKVTYETSLKRYGEMIDYTDEVELFSEDYIQVKYREELGELANSRYEDLIQFDMLSGGISLNAGGGASKATIGANVDADQGAADVTIADSAYTVSYDLIRTATRKLFKNRAKKNTSIVTGSTKIGTAPVAKAYYAIIGADVKADLETLTRGESYEKEFVYIPAHKYADAGSLAEGEVGAMHEVRFIESESALVFRGAGAAVPAGYNGDLAYTDVSGTNKFDVFPILFPTEGSFATIGLKGNEKIKFNSKSPAQVDSGNTYGTTGFFSYNFFYAGIVLRPEALLTVNVAARA